MLAFKWVTGVLNSLGAKCNGGGGGSGDDTTVGSAEMISEYLMVGAAFAICTSLAVSGVDAEMLGPSVTTGDTLEDVSPEDSISLEASDMSPVTLAE